MGERVSRTQRVKTQNVAETEVMRYAGDHALWHKYVHDVELDAVQLLKMAEMDEHPNTIDFSTRRSRKTTAKELYNMEYLATHADQELGIVAPRQAQAKTNLNYMIEAIQRSPILSGFVSYRSGRTQLSDTKFEFANHSRAWAEGVMAQVDGGDLTMASLEEVDDMPRDRLFANFLLMMGATARLGASASSLNNPQIRITGVYKGSDTLTDMLEGDDYYVLGAYHGSRAREELASLIEGGWVDPGSVDIDNYKYPVPILNAPAAIKMGLVNAQVIKNLRTGLSDDEIARQLACINTSSRNLVWDFWMQKARQVGLDARLELAGPLPGQTYQKRGLLSFGYDHSGHGEKPESSKSALVVLEQIGNFTCPIFAKTWRPGVDDGVVKNDLIGLWRYFMPDYAIGDAYGVGMMTQLNDELYAERLTMVDRRTIGDGDSTASTWTDWPFAPMRFEGMVKHSMAQAVRAAFHNGQTAIPYVTDEDTDPVAQDIVMMCRQIVNIKPEVSKASYSTYKMATTKLGDDLFDAYMAAVWALLTRGAIPIQTVIKTKTNTREQILGAPSIRLPSDPVAA